MTNKSKDNTANKLSDELERLINKVRLVPMNAEFFVPDFHFRQECIETLFCSHKDNPDSNFGEARVSVWIEENTRWLEIALEHLPREFQKYILENEATASFIEQLDKEFNTSNFYKFLRTDFVLQPETTGSLLQLIQSQFKYEEFHTVKNQFYFIIGLSLPPQTEMSKNKVKIAVSAPANYPARFLNKANFEMDNDGVFYASLDEFFSAVNNKNVTRIRICKSCYRVFWANRNDAKCCSKKCLNLFHVKRSNSQRRNDPEYIWKQEMKNKASVIARTELKKLGFTDADEEVYRVKNRKFANRIIYDYLVTEMLKPETKKSVDKVKIPKAVIQPLLDFLTLSKKKQ